MADEKYSRCPDCGRKTVYFKARANGEDGYTCRRSECNFEFFTLGDSRIDRDNEDRWHNAQHLPLDSDGVSGRDGGKQG